MTEPAAITDSLLVARTPDTALVRVEGRGTFRQGGPLKQFLAASLGEGCREVVVDCGPCQGMDSTFMGVIAGAACRLQATRDGRIALVNLSERSLRNITTLGLTRVVDAHLAGDTPDRIAALLDRAGAEAIAPRDETEHELTRTMLRAHEDLVTLDDSNRERFRDVLAYLREDARRQEGS